MSASEQNLRWMHDLRVQIQLLHGNVEMIYEAAQGQKIVWNRVDVSEHVDALMKCSDMVKTMLAERMELEARPVADDSGGCDLGTIAQGVIHSVSAYAKGVGKQCVCEISGAPRMTGSRVKIERALYNLVTNAVFHTPEGTRIRVRVAQREAGAFVAVEDDGPGLSPEQAAILQSGGPEGSGLSSVHCLVGELGGCILVKRVDGYNSIQILLPAS